MKKTLFLLSITFLMLQSCSSNDSSSNPPLTVEAVQNVAASGTWKITYLDTQAGVNKTSEFQGYRFTFNQTNNSTTANYLNDNYQGTWDVIEQTDQTDQIFFYIDFSGHTNFIMLDADWKVISISDSKIVLKLSDNFYAWHHADFDPIYKPDDLIFEKI